MRTIRFARQNGACLRHLQGVVATTRDRGAAVAAKKVEAAIRPGRERADVLAGEGKAHSESGTQFRALFRGENLLGGTRGHRARPARFHGQVVATLDLKFRKNLEQPGAAGGSIPVASGAG